MRNQELFIKEVLKSKISKSINLVQNYTKIESYQTPLLLDVRGS